MESPAGSTGKPAGPQGEQRFRSLVETTSDWVWEVDHNLVYTYASPSVQRILGHQPEEVLGKRPWDLMPPEEAERVGQAIAAAIRTRQPFTAIENVNRHRAGHDIILETSGVPFFGEDGQFLGYRGIDRDVTARRQAEQALAASERRFRDLLSTVHLAAVMLNCEGRITFLNEYFLHLTGWREQDVIGSSWFDAFVPEPVREQVKAIFLAAITAENLPAHYENPIVTRDGHFRLIDWDNTLLRDPAGKVIGTASLGRDVTEVKQLEDLYRQAQKLESVGRLAGGIAHDFNNLLTVINGYSNLLLDHMSGSDPNRTAVERILKAGERAASLTEHLLAFSRRQVIQVKPLNLNTMLSDMESTIRPLLREGVELETVAGPALDPVLADEGQMHQVLMNLVVNAVDAMPHGGRLTITTANVTLDRESAAAIPEAIPGPCVLLSVADTGIGMDQETQSRIFEPFFTTKPAGVGTGLGLSTVYGIVRQEHGWIRVTSAPAKGSVFEIYLPRLSSALALEEPAVPAPGTVSGAETVLVVEDRADVRTFTAQALRTYGYHVIDAASGEEALETASAHQGTIHLLLADVVMPGIDGPELAERLQKLRPGIRLLLMSGYTESRIVLPDGAGPRPAFLSKPFAPDDLAAKVREVLET